MSTSSTPCSQNTAQPRWSTGCAAQRCGCHGGRPTFWSCEYTEVCPNGSKWPLFCVFHRDANGSETLIIIFWCSCRVMQCYHMVFGTISNNSPVLTTMRLHMKRKNQNDRMTCVCLRLGQTPALSWHETPTAPMWRHPPVRSTHPNPSLLTHLHLVNFTTP